MKNRTLLPIIGISIITAIVGVLIFYFSDKPALIEIGQYMYRYGLQIGSILGLFLIIFNGTFIKTKYFNIVKWCIGIILFGYILVILHWTIFAKYIIYAGFAGVITSYSISFAKKRIRERLDYLKLIWVITCCTLPSLILSHIVSSEYAIIANYIFLLVFIDYCFTSFRNKNFIKTE
ncbi:MAG: hypothetical protein N4A72_17065 [Bacteroidales bacterium]|jgi:hypothetical protein|nr:hypothetical protein [Bacteroidales bacterium]